MPGNPRSIDPYRDRDRLAKPAATPAARPLPAPPPDATAWQERGIRGDAPVPTASSWEERGIRGNVPNLPYKDPYSYENIQYGYKPQLVADPERLAASSLGMQRYQAGQGANAAVNSGLQTGMSSIASSSGLSLADRRALQEQGQRQRVQGMQAAQVPFNQMQAENLYQADQANIQNRQRVAAQNQAILNQYEEDKAAFERQKQEMIYRQKNEEARLQQALEAAARTAY